MIPMLDILNFISLISNNSNNKMATVWEQIYYLLIINFLCAVGYSIIAPIYPPLALERSITPDTTGIIFTTFAISSILVSPIIPKTINRLGKKALLKYCTIIEVYINKPSQLV
jgi:predicted MFS family arabinose efflux permease